jgi:hypothetical protein
MTLRLIGTVVIEKTLHILNNLPSNIVLGMEAQRKLHMIVTLNSETIFNRRRKSKVQRLNLLYQKEKEITFVSRTTVKGSKQDPPNNAEWWRTTDI